MKINDYEDRCSVKRTLIHTFMLSSHLVNDSFWSLLLFDI